MYPMTKKIIKGRAPPKTGRVSVRKRKSGQKLPLTLAAWIGTNIRLPATMAQPGPVKLWPFMTEIANALTDPKIERVSLIKSARTGFTTLLSSLVAFHVVEQPALVLIVLPTEADARNYIIEIEQLFDSSPALQGRLPTPTTAGRSARNSLCHRLYKGGSLKVVSGKAPRNLRAHTARILLLDETDAIAVSAEGDPLSLAEQRTLSFANRKIICGSTPLDEATSHIARQYSQSDQRVFEVPCPCCGAFTEIRWANIEWEPSKPQTAAFRCPHCAELVEEAHKPQMVSGGRWRATAPGVTGHAGFRINALVSPLANAGWGKLAAEFLKAKDDSDTLRVFVNTVLGETWREAADEISDTDLLARVEPFDLDHIPPEVLAVTAGCDVQDDRVEVSIVGHARDGTAYVLNHQTIWGSPLTDDTWSDVDKLLAQRWRHPHGGMIKVDVSCIDAGDGGVYDVVLKFCNQRIGRKILAIKGVAGFARPAIQVSKTKKGRLFIVGVDNLKTQILTRLARGRTIRFSHSCDAVYFEQLASERRIVRMARGRPVARFERKVGKAAEALDCLVYSFAARAALSLNEAAFEQRESETHGIVVTAPIPAVIKSNFMSQRGF
jgi:phage terminase large subunit GpA-like protein